MRKSNRYILTLGAVYLVLSALGSAHAQQTTPDQNRIWTTAGSAGTLDKNDLGKVSLVHSVVQLGFTLAGNIPVAQNLAKGPVGFPLPTESAVIRYNVTPVDGLFDAPPVSFPSSQGVQLKLRYLAVNAQVIAKLIEVDLATGAETDRLTFNSNAFPAVDGYHVQQVGECGPTWKFDFKAKAYYIEATLTQTPIFVGSAAGIQVIRSIITSVLDDKALFVASTSDALRLLSRGLRPLARSIQVAFPLYTSQFSGADPHNPSAAHKRKHAGPANFG